MTTKAVVIAAALLVTSCSTSPIKRLVCKDNQGEIVADVTYNLNNKTTYVYDAFTESLKRDEGDPSWPVFETAFTDSGKIKARFAYEPLNIWGKYPIYGEIEVDTNNLTANSEIKEWKSKLIDLRGLTGESLKKGLDKNSAVLSSDELSYNESTTKRIGTCNFEQPKTTKVFGESEE